MVKYKGIHLLLFSPFLKKTIYQLQKSRVQVISLKAVANLYIKDSQLRSILKEDS